MKNKSNNIVEIKIKNEIGVLAKIISKLAHISINELNLTSQGVHQILRIHTNNNIEAELAVIKKYESVKEIKKII